MKTLRDYQIAQAKNGSFWRGIVVAYCVNSLIQDLYGKEAYIKRVQEGWIDTWITAPFATAALLLMLLSASFAHDRDKKNLG